MNDAGSDGDKPALQGGQSLPSKWTRPIEKLLALLTVGLTKAFPVVAVADRLRLLPDH